MNELVQREMTQMEIRQRQVDHLRILSEIDNYQSEIEEHARCAKDAKTEIARLQSRERELRGELRSGCVWEARQKKLDFADGSNDEPNEDIDPPAVDDWDRFVKRWPVCRDHVQLRSDLSVALQGVKVPTLEQLQEWHPDSGIFQGVASWVRLEVAHMNAKEDPDLVLPGRQPMPEKLAELMGGKAKKKRRPRATEQASEESATTD